LGGTNLAYGTVGLAETPRDPEQAAGDPIPPRNSAPVADADTTLSVDEDSGNSALNIGAPTDLDGDPLTITVTGIPNAAIGTVYLADGITPVTNGMTLSVVELTGLVFRPVADANGAAGSFSYTVDDGHGGSDSQTISLTVIPVNDAPTAVADSFSANEDSAVTGNVLTNDTDVDSSTLNAILVSGPAHGSLTLNADGSFTYTPNADYNGPDSFTYKASDGQADSNVATVSINVTPVNDAPVAVADSFSTNEDNAVTGNVLANDTDVDGNALNAILVSGPAHGSLTLNADGSFTYTPSA